MTDKELIEFLRADRMRKAVRVAELEEVLGDVVKYMELDGSISPKLQERIRATLKA